MSHPATRREDGFSAVELLITLFIAALFLIVGHQLYATIIQDSGEMRQQARASNIAYDYLRRDTTSSGPCTSATPTTIRNNQAITPDPEGLTMVRVTTIRSCPQPITLPSLSKITTTVRYGADQKEVTHALFASN